MMNDLITYILLLLHPYLIANQVKIVSLGGIEAIIKAMTSHKDHSGVQEKACGALRNLAFNDGVILVSLIRSFSDASLSFVVSSCLSPFLFMAMMNGFIHIDCFFFILF